MQNNKHTIKKIGKLLKPRMPLVVLSFVFALLSVVFTLYSPVLIGRAIDVSIGQGHVDFDALKGVLLQFLFVIGANALSQWGMSQCNNYITYEVVKDVREQTFRHFNELPLSYIDSHSYGDIISRMITDIDQFSDGLLLGFSQLFTGVVTIVGTIFFMLSIDFKITLIVVLLTPLSLFVASFIAKNTYKYFTKQTLIRGKMTDLVNEMVGNQKVVEAFAYEERAKEQFQEINEELNVCSKKAVFYSSLTNPCTRFVNSMVYAGVGVFGAFYAMKGVITVGQLSCFLNYANQYTKPFNEISGVITELQNAFACAQRVFEILEEPGETPDDEDAVSLEKVTGKMEISHVNFSYKKEVPLIEDFNLSVKAGERIAIVGPTGCGKTTLINLLMRFYDVGSGTISIDGVDTKHMTRDNLRSHYGMVLQETWLKSGTIKENIAYGNPNASMEDIIKAAKEAHAHSFIMRMKDGYDSVIAEDGGNLSQGQKQLLCIARIMLCHPEILILDEATSSIDTRTEIKVQKAFAKMMEGHTSFVVAHRLSTIKESDCILVMNQGKVLEQGTHEELLAKDGFYANLYKSQFALPENV